MGNLVSGKLVEISQRRWVLGEVPVTDRSWWASCPIFSDCFVKVLRWLNSVISLHSCDISRTHFSHHPAFQRPWWAYKLFPYIGINTIAFWSHRIVVPFKSLFESIELFNTCKSVFLYIQMFKTYTVYICVIQWSFL